LPRIAVDSESSAAVFGETVQRLATLWRDCDAAERERFQKLAAERKERIATGRNEESSLQPPTR
jgi:hypothetical protein